MKNTLKAYLIIGAFGFLIYAFWVFVESLFPDVLRM